MHTGCTIASRRPWPPGMKGRREETDTSRVRNQLIFLQSQCMPRPYIKKVAKLPPPRTPTKQTYHRPSHKVTEEAYGVLSDCVERRVGCLPTLCGWKVCEPRNQERTEVEWHIPADAWPLPARSGAVKRPSSPIVHDAESVNSALDRLRLTPEQKLTWHSHDGRGMYG